MDEDVTIKTQAACRRTAKVRQFMAAFLVSLLGCCSGMSVAWVAPMQPLLMSEHPPVGTEPMSEDIIAWLASVNYLGNAGIWFWGLATDRVGRKAAACFCSISYIVCYVVTLFARDYVWLIVARLSSGVGIGGISLAVPLFIAEMAQDDLRGFFGSFGVIFFNVGVVYTYVAGTCLSYRAFTICCLIIPIIFVISFVWMPETPIFLWKNGEIEKAEQSLLWYRGGDSAETTRTLESYKLFPKERNKSMKSLKSLVSTKGNTKASIIGLILMTAFPLSGYLTISTFAVSIFDACGSSISSYQSAITMATVQMISAFFCSFASDRFGRKGLLLASLLTIALFLAILGAFLVLSVKDNLNFISRLTPILCLSICMAAFAAGLGPVAYIIMSEIFTPDTRGCAMSVLSLYMCIVAFTMNKSFPSMKELFRLEGCFFFYSFCCCIFALFFYFYLPETKGLPQSEILQLLNEENITIASSAKETEKLNKCSEL